jgi:tetratricopeptide (TPR) repeat protein
MVSCGEQSGRNITFRAEKLYIAAEKMSQSASFPPDRQNYRFRGKIKEAYFNVTNFCWSHLDSLPVERFPDERRDLENIAYYAAGRISGLFFAEKKYDSVIIINRQLLNFTNLEGFPLLNTRINMARAYQSLGNMTEAMSIYRTLMDSFYPPVDNNNTIIYRVLNLPLQIIQMYFLISDEAAAAAETESAMAYYDMLIRDWPDSELETAAHGNLARLFYEQKEWDKAIENLYQVKDSTGNPEIGAALMIAGITATGKNDYQTAIEIYDRIADRVDDSTMLAVILMRKGIVYFRDNKYEFCRKTMSQINDDYPKFFRGNPLPQKYLALSFEQMGDWIRAENEFRWLIDNYPRSETAFDAFFSIADHYEQAGNKEFTRDWYQRADKFYTGMAEQYSGSSTEASAYSYLAEVAKRRGKWELSARYLATIFEKFPQTDIGRRSFLNASLIQREKLGNPARADSMILRLQAELYPPDKGKNIDVLTDDNNYK